MSPLLLTFIFFLTTNIRPSLCLTRNFLTCLNPFNCGNLTAYPPFWDVDSSQPCGFPELGLKCEHNTTSMIHINGVKYKILGITGTSQTLRISRADYQHGLCGPQFLNTIMNYPFLQFYDYSNIKKITFLYECSSFPESTTSPKPLASPESISSPEPLAWSPDESVIKTSCPHHEHGVVMKKDSHGPEECKHSVTVPIEKHFISSGLKNLSALEQALKQGFEVTWNGFSERNKRCEECIKSNGSCGFDHEKWKTLCYCSNQTVVSDTTCPVLAPTGGKKRTKLSQIDIGIGIAAGSVSAVFFGVMSILIIRRYKREMAAQHIRKDLETQPASENANIHTTTTTNTTSTGLSNIAPSCSLPTSDIGKRSNYFGAQVFSHVELENATNNFDSSNVLGDGGFGTVYHGVLDDGREVAVKRLYERNFKRVQQFLTEVEILTNLRHSNLVTLYGCTSRRSRELLLVYEYIPNGTLGDHLHGEMSKSGLLTWPTRLSIAIDTAVALAYLHKSDVIHRDVKSNNILLDKNFHGKVGDFGLSRLFPNGVTHVSTAPQGTPGYLDPDYYHCYKLTNKIDVYSFGVVLIELISSLPAVDTNTIRHDINLSNMAVDKIRNHALHELVDPNLGFETDSKVRNMIMLVAELAFRCLQQDKEIRPSMQELVEVLREIQDNGKSGNLKEEEVDICETDEKVVLLKNDPSTLSPNSSSS